MEQKKNIKSYSRSELQQIMTELGEQKYRADQIRRWLFNDRSSSFEAMSNLGSSLRAVLSSGYSIPSCAIIKEQRESAADNIEGTTKYLVSLHDGLEVETVLIPSPDRKTVCVSSQAGCPLGCTFCATGYMGFTRNLNAAEIVEQVYLADDKTTKGDISNVVFMGMGEPLLNLPNVIEAVDILSDQRFDFSLPQRKITISTVGLVPGIDRIARSGLKTKLAVSLHAADQRKREQLIPASKEHTLDRLHKALAGYTDKTGEPVTLVYMLLDGMNDTPDDARMLAKFSRGFLCKINLIDYNSIVNMKFKHVNSERQDHFIAMLVDAGLHVTVRRSHGASINAACGQLALSEKKAVSSARYHS